MSPISVVLNAKDLRGATSSTDTRRKRERRNTQHVTPSPPLSSAYSSHPSPGGYAPPVSGGHDSWPSSSSSSSSPCPPSSVSGLQRPTARRTSRPYRRTRGCATLAGHPSTRMEDSCACPTGLLSRLGHRGDSRVSRCRRWPGACREDE